MADLFSVNLSRATIETMSRRAGERLLNFADAVRQLILLAPVKHLDETGFRIVKTLKWLHVAATGWLTLLRRACHVEHLYRDKQQVPDRRLVDLIGRRYDAIVASGINFHESLPALPQKLKKDSTPRSGRPKRRVGHNLVARLAAHKADILRFLINPDVPFTNNQAERDGRMMKLKQKISGCFRSVQGANDFMVIRTLIATAKKQGWGIIQSLMRDTQDLINELKAA
jgi:transposase